MARFDSLTAMPIGFTKLRGSCTSRSLSVTLMKISFPAWYVLRAIVQFSWRKMSGRLAECVQVKAPAVGGFKH